MFGGVARQTEDELSGINMAMGAALTGARVMVGTPGPGFSLMQEGIGHAGSAEIPIVIVDCQRAGPSTGMPTKPEQSDINLMIFDSHGDFPRVDEDPDYNCTDRGKAFSKSLEILNNHEIPIGLLYHGEHVSLESLSLKEDCIPPALQDLNSPDSVENCKNIIQSFMG